MRPLFFLIILSLSKVSFSQSEALVPFRNHILKIHSGVALPVNDFSSTDFNSDESGYATSGYNFRISYHFFPLQNFGFGVAIGSSVNDMDRKEIQKNFTEAFGTHADVETGSWEIFYTTAELVGQFPIGKFYPYAITGIGAAAVTSPELIAELPVHNFTITQQRSEEVVAMALKAGVGCSYMFGRVGLDFQVSGLFIDVEDFEFLDEATGEISTTSQDINRTNIDLGISILLGKKE